MKARKHMDKAIEIKQGTPGFLIQLRDEIRPLLSKITSNSDLSASGKYNKEKEIKELKGLEAIQKMHIRKQQYISQLQKAKSEAEAFINQAIKKPDDAAIEKFTKDYRAFKVELKLTTNVKSAESKLNDFISGISDQYFADVMRNDFSEIIGTVLSLAGPQAGEYKMRLNDTFETLKTAYLPEGAVEAKIILDDADFALGNPLLFNNELGPNAAIDTFGPIGKFIDKTDEFFTQFQYEDLKPTDIQDLEIDDEEVATRPENWKDLLSEAEAKARSGKPDDIAVYATLKNEFLQ